VISARLPRVGSAISQGNRAAAFVGVVRRPPPPNVYGDVRADFFAELPTRESSNSRSDPNASRLRARMRAERVRRYRSAIAIEKVAHSGRRSRFSAKYFLLLCSNCAMLLKIFARRVGKSCERSEMRAEQQVFSSLGAPSDRGFAGGFVLTVESPVASSGRALCLLL
jgi:hypothetical protein